MTTSQNDTTNPAEGIAMPSATRAGRRPSRDAVAQWSRFALPGLLVAFIVVFSVLEPETFPTVNNAKTILTTQAVLAILALSALSTLVVGQFDLSIGAQLGLAQMILPGLLSRNEANLAVAIVVAVLCTTLVGAINGVLVAKLKLNSFIATLAVATILSAIVLWYSEGLVIFEGLPDSLLAITTTAPGGIPLPIFYVIALVILIWILIERMPFGRYMQAVGGSQDAARLSGINADAVTIGAFTFGGALAGVAGVLAASQVGSGNPATGPEFLLPAFAAVFLGATSFRVGRFNVWGTIVAVITVATGVAGLNLMGLPQWVSPMFNGVALLVAITATRFLRGAAAST